MTPLRTMIAGAAIAAVLALHGGREAAAEPGFIVDSGWLEQHIDDDGLVLLEVRYHPHRYFSIGHIPGAFQVQRFKDLGDNDATPLMMFPERADFQATLRGWGVDDDSTVVVYDDSRTALASRLYYLLDLYGFPMDQVKVLEGGTVGWTVFNSLEKSAPPAPEPGNVTLEPADEDLFVEWTDVYDRIVSRAGPPATLLDARPRAHYTGEVKAHSVRAGHIPGAINVVSLDGTDGETKTWKGMEALADLYADIPKDKPVVAYCHDGFRMGLAYMQLKALGYEDVRLYNGGWSHWGNNLELPVVTGETPFDEAFRL